MEFDKKCLSERDICTKFIAPTLRKGGWDEISQARKQVCFMRWGTIICGKAKFTHTVLAKQHYILAKSEELPCDRPELQLTTTQTESRPFLDGILLAALAGQRDPKQSDFQ